MSAKKTQRLGETSPVTEKLSEQALIDELAAFDRYECISVELDPFGRRAVSAPKNRSHFVGFRLRPGPKLV